MSTEVLSALLDIDAALVLAGVPPVSPYWRGEAERFYAHPSALLLVECVGRGGDKSRTSTKMAIAEVLAGQFAIPPGERHYFTHVAENRDEASKTLGVLEQYLRILRVKFTRSGDTIELAELPRGFKVLACRVGAVSGWRCIGWTADECAKWDNDGADPSAEVIASIRAMTVTHPGARGRMFSSPLGILGHFHETWSLGTTADQVTGHAASWEANPSITEERTRALERNERKWKREYAAIPTEETDESMFSAALLDRATRATPGDVPAEPGVSYVAAQDVGYVRNPWAFAIAGKRLVDGRIKRSVVVSREWRGTPDNPLDPAVVLREIAALCRAYNIAGVWSDQYEQFSLVSVASRPDIDIGVWVEHVQAPERLSRYEALLTMMSDGEIDLPPDPVLRADFLAVRQKLTPSGFTIAIPESADGRHGDRAVSAVLALSKAEMEPEVLPPAFGTPQHAALVAAREREETEALFTAMHARRQRERRDEEMAMAATEGLPRWR